MANELNQTNEGRAARPADAMRPADVARHTDAARPADVARPASRAANAAKASPSKPSAKRSAGRKPAARRTPPRRDEVGRILHASAVAAVALVLVLGVLSLFRPQINLAYAAHLIRSGRTEAAEVRLNALERDGYPAQRVANLRFALADKYLEKREPARALALLDELPEGDESREISRRARYEQAEDAYESKRFDAAAQQFYQLGDYMDSAARCSESRCAAAVLAYRLGREDDARQLLIHADDPAAHIEAAARAVISDDAEVQRLLDIDLFNPEKLAQLERTVAELSAAREGAASGRIAVGERHTVGVRTDGAVLAVGDNSSGQCDVSGWSDIVQVAAGARHTLGLRLDGTVAATGDDSFGQCDVSGWTDIIAVAANAYGSFGLKSDGTVVASRIYADRASGWHGVTRIAAGGYSAGCLYGQGAMLALHPGAQLDAAVTASQLALCGAVSAAVQADGALVSSYPDAPEWTNLHGVAVSSTVLLGVSNDGSARLYTFRTGLEEALAIDGRAVEAAAGGHHWAVLTEDGRVFAFGENDAGQCDVSGWHL